MAFGVFAISRLLNSKASDLKYCDSILLENNENSIYLPPCGINSNKANGAHFQQFHVLFGSGELFRITNFWLIELKILIPRVDGNNSFKLRCVCSRLYENEDKLFFRAENNLIRILMPRHVCCETSKKRNAKTSTTLI